MLLSILLLFGLRLPTLEFLGCWVELGLGAEMRNSMRPHSDEYSLGSFSVSLVVQTPSSHCRSFGPTPRLVNQDPSMCMGRKKKKNSNKVKIKLDWETNRYVRKNIKIKI